MSLEHIFRAYDIRGKVGDELNPETMERIGFAFGANLVPRKVENKAIVGRDVRMSSPELSEAFREGARKAGMDILNAGLTPYGPLLFKGWQENLHTAFITASHLPTDWNGVKFAHGNGIGYSAEENHDVRDHFFSRHRQARNNGKENGVRVLDPYRAYVRSKVDVKDVNVLMDCGNGSACVVAPDLFKDAGISTDVINGKPDGTFPNRESDVTEDTLSMLRARVRDGGHDLGVAYDGDADRVAVVDDSGRLLSSEQLASVLLQAIAPAHDGPVVANVECSRMLEHVARQYNKNVVRVRVGHTYLFKEMRRHDACLGVEKSGHMGVPHILPLDDGIATSLYAAEVVSKLERPLSTVVDDLPDYFKGRVTYRVPDDEKFEIVAVLQDELPQRYRNTNTMDGIRVDLDKGWVLIRASNTSPKIRLTIEAETAEAFDELNREFIDVVEEVFERFEGPIER